MDTLSTRFDMARAKVKVGRLLEMGWYFRKKMTVWMATTIEHIKRWASGDLIGTKTGHLKRNIGAKLASSADSPAVILGTGEQVGLKPVVYASIHEEGGTIRAKGKKLTVPFPGVKGRIRNYPDGFFLKSKRGNLLYVIRKGNSIVPLFHLRDQVTIPPRRWFSLPIKDRTRLLEEVFQSQQFVDELLDAGAGTGGSQD